MKHHYLDGRGLREVWLDGMLLDRVIECDDEEATAVVFCQPIRVIGDEVSTEHVQGVVLVVQPISMRTILV